MEGKMTTYANEAAVKRKQMNGNIFTYKLTEDVPDPVKRASECVENFAEVLKAEGIKVTRPEVFDTAKDIRTPIFDISQSSGATCPRDVFMVAGNNVIEAPMSWKCRYFEHYAWRKAMFSYYNRDPQMRWTCAPKPVMGDSSYNMDPKLKTINNGEILFDAADTRRFGKDFFTQSAHTANDTGRDWIKRTLAPDGIRVHEFTFADQSASCLGCPISFVHIDAKITPVDEYTMLWCAAERPSDDMFKLFRENEWKLLEMPVRYACTSPLDATGPGIHLNMLAAGPSRMFVEASETAMIKQMREEGIDVIPVPYAPCYMYGGGLNCWTLDISRDGHAKSYFPTLDEQAERLEAKEERSP